MAPVPVSIRVNPWPGNWRRYIPVALFVGLVVAPLVTVGVVSFVQFRPGGPVLEVEMQATAGDTARLFWAAEGEWWIEPNVHEVPLRRPTGQFERVNFILPRRPIDLLRFVPTDVPATVTIRHMRVVGADGRTVRDVDPGMMMPLNYAAAVSWQGDGTWIVASSGASDPGLLLRATWLAPPSSWHSVRMVSPLSLAWVSCAAFIVILTALVMLVREASNQRFGRREALWVLGLLVAIFFAKLALIRAYPAPVPFWDQWDGEGALIYVPYANQALSWRDMFALHNEHRIFFTRLLSLVLLAGNQQWDPLLQMTVNAGLHAITAAALALVFWLSAGRRGLPLIVLVTGLASAPPFAWENTLAGFQSAFYFFVLFSVLAIWLMGFHPSGSRRWMLGWLCGACALFTVAGGMITAVTIAVLVTLRTLGEPRLWRQLIVTFLAVAALLALGYGSASPPLPHHAELKAQTVRAFAAAFARNMAFPWIAQPRASLFVWLPVLGLGAMLLARRARPNALEQVVLALIVWIALQAAAMAYTRGELGVRPPASRYLDILSLVLVVNTVAFLALGGRQDTSKRRRYVNVMATVYLICGTAGVVWLSRETLDPGARERALWMRHYTRNIRTLLATGDEEMFLQKRAPEEVPYFSARMLANWVGHPHVRRILPPVVREPLRLEPSTDRPGQESSWRLVMADATRVWDSDSRGAEAGQGKFESGAISCRTTGWLRFEVAGSLREPGLSLWLEDQQSGEQIPVRPGDRGRGWVGVVVRCPDGPFSVVAVDTSSTSGFAFREPSEVGPLSAAAGWLIRNNAGFGLLSATLLLGAAWPRRGETWRAPPDDSGHG